MTLVDIRPIKSEADYAQALYLAETLFAARPDTPEGDMLDILVTLIEAYEAHVHSILPPEPIEALIYHMKSRDLTRRDLEPYIGNRARVSEILNRRRPLTLEMIRKLHSGLGIPAEILIQPYPARQTAA
jgi:HTH-type transcriptional regulator/antitoxin HigA